MKAINNKSIAITKSKELMAIFLTKLFVSSCLIVLAGCAAVPHSFVNRWTPEELPQVVSIQGDHTIEGSAFLRRSEGGVVTCAGNIVTLQRQFDVNRSAYSREVLSLPVRVRNVSAVDPRFYETQSKFYALRQSQRVTATCDVEGKFTFKYIAPGDYEASTQVQWTSTREYQVVEALPSYKPTKKAEDGLKQPTQYHTVTKQIISYHGGEVAKRFNIATGSKETTHSIIISSLAN